MVYAVSVDFRRLPQADIITKLDHICQAEGIHTEPSGLQLIAKSATGSLRDAENLLEQLSKPGLKIKIVSFEEEENMLL